MKQVVIEVESEDKAVHILNHIDGLIGDKKGIHIRVEDVEDQQSEGDTISFNTQEAISKARVLVHRLSKILQVN